MITPNLRFQFHLGTTCKSDVYAPVINLSIFITFGETIRRLQLLANMHQLHLALDWGKSISTVNRIEDNQATVQIEDLSGLLVY